jgi:hypothetical protein
VILQKWLIFAEFYKIVSSYSNLTTKQIRTYCAGNGLLGGGILIGFHPNKVFFLKTFFVPLKRYVMEKLRQKHLNSN